MAINITIYGNGFKHSTVYNALDTAQMHCYDSLLFNDHAILNVYENTSASEVVRRFLISPGEGIIYLELTDGRSWTKQKFVTVE